MINDWIDGIHSKEDTIILVLAEKKINGNFIVNPNTFQYNKGVNGKR